MIDSIVPDASRRWYAGRPCPESCIAEGGCAVLRSTRGVALITLAMLNVFTLAAGVAVVRMLPPRLALLKPLRVATRPDVQASPVLSSGVQGGPPPTRTRLSQPLAGPLSVPAPGAGAARGGAA